MKPQMKFLSILAFLVFNVSLSFSQSITGKVVDNEGFPLSNITVSVKDTQIKTQTNDAGNFKIDHIATGSYTLIGTDGDLILFTQEISFRGKDLRLGQIKSTAIGDDSTTYEDFTVISLDESDFESEDDEQEFSGILSANEDPFLRTAAFGFGSARFNARGLGSEYGKTYMNGIPMNELENGRLYYAQWGGLNDVLRNRHTNHGLTSSEYGIGGIMGNQNLDVRAGSQRQQTRVSYSLANRNYSNRIMMTHSTGFNEQGWALSVSGSRRWATEGHVTGTFYDAWGYFLGVEKKLGSNHEVFFNAMGAPNRRGKAGAALQEIVDIVGDRFYNPYWGYQDGKKRNSRVGHAHQPLFLLGHDWNSDSGNTTISSAVSYQIGRNGGTALNWADANNPSSDYHRKLPSRIEDETLRNEIIAELQKNDNDFFQINWDYLYEANRINNRDIENVDGIEGNTVSGKEARYIIEDRRYDSKELNGNINITQTINSNNILRAGARYQSYKGHNFSEIEDLLGADFYLDVDKYADGITNPASLQKDLERPNRLVREGDIFGYDYNSNIVKPSLWFQNEFSSKLIDVFVGAEISNTTFNRVGNMRNGYYPDNSLGKSEDHSFNNYMIKSGLTYKLNGRTHLWASGLLGTMAPLYRNAYLNARSNDFTVPLLENSKQKSAELGFQYKSPSITLKGTGYFADIDDETDVVFFFSDTDFVLSDGQSLSGAFGSFINHNIDKRHVGLELAAEVKLNTEFSVKTVAALGQHLYDSRWVQYAKSDEIPGFFREELTVYTDKFYVETSPQTAANVELKYSSPHFWFATISFNYFNNRYLDFSMDRRLAASTEAFPAGSQELRDITVQEKLPSNYVMDFFVYKSFKWNDYRMALSFSLNNMLDNQEFITGGYEQLRFDPTRGKDYFASKYFYGYGRNYFIGLAFSL